MKKIVFDNLIMLAQQERPPAVNVADSVIVTLSGITQGAVADPWRPFLWTGVVSAAAACILIAATFLLQSGSDSVSDMMTYVAWVTQ